MANGLEMLLLDCWQIAQSHAAVARDTISVVACTTINRHIVASLHHADTELLHAGLEAAICGWNTAGADEANPQRFTPGQSNLRGARIDTLPSDHCWRCSSTSREKG